MLMKKKRRTNIFRVQYLIIILILLLIFIIIYKDIRIMTGQIVDTSNVPGYENGGILIQKGYLQYADYTAKLENFFPRLHYGDSVWVLYENFPQEPVPKDIKILIMIKWF